VPVPAPSPAELQRLVQTIAGRLGVIASIEDEAVIERLLDHLGTRAESLDLAHPSRAPPQGNLPW
jgi:hypothetical protein